jgi:hypothetical protein
MKPKNRAFIGLGVFALLLIGLTLALRSSGRESTADAAPESNPEPGSTEPNTPMSQHAKASKVRLGAAGGAAFIPLHAEDRASAEVTTECKACRETTCTNYRGLGYDVLNGCLDQVDPSEGADKSDSKFNDDCVAVVRCATKTRCAEGPAGPLGCYCGSATVDDCIEVGPGADAPCGQEWRRAARTSDHHELMLRWSDLKYPTGWANLLIECDRDDCKNKCTG